MRAAASALWTSLKRVRINRTGVWYTVIAVACAVVSALALAVSASENQLFVNQLVFLGVALFVVFVVLGSTRWLATSSVPMLATVVLESGFGETPSWVRSIVIGCLWFATMELGWEAIERRDAALHTTAANARRLQEVATVVAGALAVGLIAAAAASFAPVRSVLLQAIVLGALLAGLVMTVRHLTPPPRETVDR